MAKALRYKPKLDPLKNLLLDVAKERSSALVRHAFQRCPRFAKVRPPSWAVDKEFKFLSDKDELRNLCAFARAVVRLQGAAEECDELAA